jgi:N-acetylmuramic acid 6-phosphate etherase
MVGRTEAAPGNVRLLDNRQLLVLFEGIGAAFPAPDAVGIGMAGARTEPDRRRIREAARKVWGSIPCQVTDDLETALAAMPETDGAHGAVRVLIVSGTGSCCFGRDAKGRTAKVGGWGHILGDGGSGYDIGLSALRAVVARWDESGQWPALGSQFLRRLRRNDPHKLIAWAQGAHKLQVAWLAKEVFRAAEKGDRMARAILGEALESLARDAITCARKLATPRTRVQFILTGGNLLKQPRFAAQMGVRLRKLWPGAVVMPLPREGAWGAAGMAGEIWHARKKSGASSRTANDLGAKQSADKRGVSGFEWVNLPPTEQRHPRSSNLDRMRLEDAIGLMVMEDGKIPWTILPWHKKIATAVRLVARAFKSGGRLFYVGAGTSGRLGVLDASECPPTFRTPPELVQGIIAGGTPALVRSVEGAEDDAGAGAEAIKLRKVNARDVMVGITASGRTPFVWGALDEAARRRAKTVLLCFNPFRKMPGHRRPTLVIAPQVGPEILTGSTRLKAGTATKMILNMLTTLALARTGRVVGNLMVDLNPSNAKLRDRAVRIVRELCGVDEAAARTALEGCGWIVQRACAKLGLS